MSWWDRKYGKNRVCGITLKRIRPGVDKDGYKKFLFLPCKHGFDRIAILTYIFNTTEYSCPTCRKVFNPLIFQN